MKHSLLKIAAFVTALLACTSLWATEVETLLSAEEAPDGVVFEIVSGEKGLLSKLLPTIKADIKKLRERFPGLDIAIVTHGNEQFDLLTEKRDSETATHTLAKELVNVDEVNVHVCGEHARWRDKAPEDFPDYVNVAATGPAQIRTYVDMGYVVISLP
ncbi:MAG: DsrE family protein [Gammaproteobacteria bacterium]|nr:DsrE family protein [Gammaproteobacteria bacterium]